MELKSATLEVNGVRVPVTDMKITMPVERKTPPHWLHLFRRKKFRDIRREQEERDRFWKQKIEEWTR